MNLRFIYTNNRISFGTESGNFVSLGNLADSCTVSKMAEGDVFKFERFFLKIFEEGYLVCCDCEENHVNKFTRKGLVQHANSAHGRAVDVVNRAECNTKQLVIR